MTVIQFAAADRLRELSDDELAAVLEAGGASSAHVRELARRLEEARRGHAAGEGKKTRDDRHG